MDRKESKIHICWWYRLVLKRLHWRTLKFDEHFEQGSSTQNQQRKMRSIFCSSPTNLLKSNQETNTTYNSLKQTTAKYQEVNLTKEAKDFKSLQHRKKKLKKSQNGGVLPCLWISRINIVKMARFLKKNCKFNGIPIKIQCHLSQNKTKSYPWIVWKYERAQWPKQSWRTHHCGPPMTWLEPEYIVDSWMNRREQKTRKQSNSATNILKTYINYRCCENCIITCLSLRLGPSLSVVQKSIQSGPKALMSGPELWCHYRKTGNASRYTTRHHRKIGNASRYTTSQWLPNYPGNDFNRSGNNNSWQVGVFQMKMCLHSKGKWPRVKRQATSGQTWAS